MAYTRRHLLCGGASLLAVAASFIARRGSAQQIPAAPDRLVESDVLAQAKALQPKESHDARQRVLRVGRRHQITTIDAAARIARDGDIVEIDAGDYPDDVATWPQSGIVIRAVGGRARLHSTRVAAEGKGIFVVKGDRVVVENIEFSGARVPHRNGSGIRHEGGKLTVRNCLFEQNEMGLLTWNEQTAELVVESSEFRDNGVSPNHAPGDPIGHQLYAGLIDRFTLRDSYVHRGTVGHLVKSRAKESLIVNNRLTDEHDGRASYELEFPSGGIAYVLGNIIGQSAQTENEAIVSFGAEGYRWPDNELYLINNTLIDELPRGGVFLRVRPGAGRIEAINNLLFGDGDLELAGAGEYRANFHARAGDFAAPGLYDYRLKRGSKLVGKAEDPGSTGGVDPRPGREYVHPRQSRPVRPQPYSPGALQGLAP